MHQPLNQENLENLINQLLKEKSVLGNFEFSLDIDKVVSWEKIDELIKINVYRIVQESLQNIVKHAAATKVSIAFSIVNDQLSMAINDNGKGFNTKKSRKGIGVKNIESSVHNMRGTLTINAKLNKGTQQAIQIPIP